MAAAPQRGRSNKSNSGKDKGGASRSKSRGKSKGSGKSPRSPPQAAQAAQGGQGDKADEKDGGNKAVVMDTLTRKDRREFREAFQLFDKDDDGTITCHELQEVFTGLNFHFTTKQLEQMINTIDDNGDGKIDFEEFILMMRGDVYNDPSNSKSYHDELKDAFDVFDKDGNGSISVQELQSTMEALGENLTQDDIYAMIGEVDADGDGNIDFVEFEKMMKQDHLLVDLARDNNKITATDLANNKRKRYANLKGNLDISDTEDDEKSD